MGKQRIKPNYRRRVLRLPDLDHCKLAVLNSLGSPANLYSGGKKGSRSAWRSVAAALTILLAPNQNKSALIT
jgi:hypothetical protein